MVQDAFLECGSGDQDPAGIGLYAEPFLRDERPGQIDQATVPEAEKINVVVIGSISQEDDPSRLPALKDKGRRGQKGKTGHEKNPAGVNPRIVEVEAHHPPLIVDPEDEETIFQGLDHREKVLSSPQAQLLLWARALEEYGAPSRNGSDRHLIVPTAGLEWDRLAYFELRKSQRRGEQEHPACQADLQARFFIQFYR